MLNVYGLSIEEYRLAIQPYIKPKATTVKGFNQEKIFFKISVFGEFGEVCNILKKYFRDGIVDSNHLGEELGDLMFYLVNKDIEEITNNKQIYDDEDLLETISVMITYITFNQYQAVAEYLGAIANYFDITSILINNLRKIRNEK